jgi:thioredoxin-related protein
VISRRRFGGLALAGAGFLAAGNRVRAAPSDPEPELAENGLHTQPWFLESFLELADDLAEARDAGKRLAVMWEQVGCPYCRETHLVTLRIPEIRDYIRANFEILQLDIHGAREVVDFNGDAMTEKALARRNGARYTPTIQFFPETLAEIAGRTGSAAEVARMPGYFRPFHFLTMFEYVREKGYAEGDFRAFLKAKVGALKAAGKPLPSW